MITAEEAYKKTQDYIKNPFDFKKRTIESFKNKYCNELENFAFYIEEATRKKKLILNYDVSFSDIYHYYDVRKFLALLYKEKKLDNLILYLNSLDYNTSYKVQYLIDLFSIKSIPVGLKSEINWKI
ncbi:MAG: hypothetical protein K2X69_10545 [Silvanigrellaceae bacterium]|nr:hypothetical protein [Silvanigrellaceae bacterium]